MDLADVRLCLRESGIMPGDVLMVHGDAIVSAQLHNIPKEKRLGELFKVLIDYLGPNGTIVIPTFTYSATRGEEFDVQSSPSRIGMFSEEFRIQYPDFRSFSPIFSIVSLGRHHQNILDAPIDDCFGPESFFALLHQLNAKVMCLGCKFEITYAHYVEQSLGVKYRYFKYFNGTIINQQQQLNLPIRYFVGDLGIRYTLNLERIKDRLVKKNMFHSIPFGRFNAYTVCAKNFYDEALVMVNNDEFALIEEGLNV